eukprot:COSAG02_NODE_265_length_26599_cov_13.943698_3_plen_178_part_00
MAYTFSRPQWRTSAATAAITPWRHALDCSASAFVEHRRDKRRAAFHSGRAQPCVQQAGHGAVNASHLQSAKSQPASFPTALPIVTFRRVKFSICCSCRPLMKYELAPLSQRMSSSKMLRCTKQHGKGRSGHVFTAMPVLKLETLEICGARKLVVNWNIITPSNGPWIQRGTQAKQLA